jgi:hypothetical protein
MKMIALIVVLCCLGATATTAKDLGRALNGHIITCAEAARYRDNVLIKEYDAISARYADGTAERQKLVLQKLNAQLKQLDDKWAKTAPAGERSGLY